MTSYVLGNNTSMLAVGVSDMNGVPTPFISVVDVSKINISDAEFVEGKDECDDMVRRIKDAGGVVIHIHNPIAASNLHAMLACLFENTSQGTWGITTYQKETIQ